MKKTSLMKAMLILVIGVILISVSTSVLAADDDYTELTLNNTTNNTNTNTKTNTNTNTNTNKVNNTNTNRNNSTIYNNTNTDLPKTGIEDSIPVALLVAVFGISAVYAYKKISDYRNI